MNFKRLKAWLWISWKLVVKLWTWFYNGQIHTLQFTQRLRDKEAKKMQQNTNLFSKREKGRIGKLIKNLMSVQRWPGSAEDEFTFSFVRSLMFVKGPWISLFPELLFFFPQFGNSTKRTLDFKCICPACSGCYELQIKTLASKGGGVLWRWRAWHRAREPMDQWELEFP